MMKTPRQLAIAAWDALLTRLSSAEDALASSHWWEWSKKLWLRDYIKLLKKNSEKARILVRQFEQEAQP